MSSPEQSFLTPVGRLVGGRLDAPEENRQNPEKQAQYVALVAFSKSDPATEALRAHIRTVAQTLFAAKPTLLARSDFAWKWRDGDSVDTNQKGVRWCDKPGYPGHWVFAFASRFPPSVLSAQGHLIDPKTVERGYYVRVCGTMGANVTDQKPSVFLNLGGVQFVREGERIATGLNVAAMFAAAPLPSPQLPGVPLSPMAGSLPDPSFVSEAVGELTSAGKATGKTYAELRAGGLSHEQLRLAGLAV